MKKVQNLTKVVLKERSIEKKKKRTVLEIVKAPKISIRLRQKARTEARAQKKRKMIKNRVKLKVKAIVILNTIQVIVALIDTEKKKKATIPKLKNISQEKKAAAGAKRGTKNQKLARADRDPEALVKKSQANQNKSLKKEVTVEQDIKTKTARIAKAGMTKRKIEVRINIRKRKKQNQAATQKNPRQIKKVHIQYSFQLKPKICFYFLDKRKQATSESNHSTSDNDNDVVMIPQDDFIDTIDLVPSDVDLDLDDEDETMRECYRIFNEYRPEPIKRLPPRVEEVEKKDLFEEDSNVSI